MNRIQFAIYLTLILLPQFAYSTQASTEEVDAAASQRNELPEQNVTPAIEEVTTTTEEQEKLNGLAAETPVRIELITSMNIETIITQVIGFLVTIFIVMMGTRSSIKAIEASTYQSLKSFQDTITSQKEIADKGVRVEVLSANRQDWINQLRSEVSVYLARIIQFRNLGNTTEELFRDFQNIKKEFNVCKDESEKDKLTTLMVSSKETMEESRSKERQICEKLRISRETIHLLLNPQENKSKLLLNGIDQSFSKVLNPKHSNEIDDDVVEIRVHCQKILKEEWERVKRSV